MYIQIFKNLKSSEIILLDKGYSTCTFALGVGIPVK
jgi:hypothetical protein